MFSAALRRRCVQVAEPLHFAVIGHPIAHSRSPEIHSAFARQFNISLNYRRIDAEDGEFEQAVDRFFRDGGRGMNVTLPYKGAAFSMCVRCSARALRSAAVNTLHHDGESLVGDNTDGIGLVRDIERLANAQHVTLPEQRVLLVGAGGGARGVVAGLSEAGVSLVAITARDTTRARDLADLFADRPGVVALDGAWLGDEHFDIVINATSAGLSGEAPALEKAWLEDAWLAYDLGYAHAGQSSTPFLNNCQAHGVKLGADGLGMLVEQAAESFLVWHGKRPDVAPVLHMLRGAAS